MILKIYKMQNSISQNKGFPCPCCGYLTLSEGGHWTFEICPICFWEDDKVQFEDPSYSGGANKVSLEQARKNFAEFGAKERRFIGEVRKPHESEIP